MTRALSQISIENYLNGGVKEKLGRNQKIVLECLEDLYPATAEMVAESMGWPINSVSGRFTELARKQKIRVAYVRPNSRGYKVRYWIPANALSELGDND